MQGHHSDWFAIRPTGTVQYKVLSYDTQWDMLNLKSYQNSRANPSDRCGLLFDPVNVKPAQLAPARLGSVCKDSYSQH
jgi:hypothetical protein